MWGSHFGAGVLVLALSRLLFPGRPLVLMVSAGVLHLLPVVLKTTAMFHPQQLAMFDSLLAFWITARMIVLLQLPAAAMDRAGDDARRCPARSLGLDLDGRGDLLATLAAAAVARAGGPAAHPVPRSSSLRSPPCSSLPWYIHLQRSTRQRRAGRRDGGLASFDDAFGLPLQRRLQACRT